MTVSLNGQTLATGSIAPGTMGNLMPLSFDSISPQADWYNLTCTASAGNQTYTATSSLSYRVTSPYGGCGSKVDRLSGATMVRNATAGELEWRKIIPIGFFDVSKCLA